jgi:peptide-methionine (S)-S-oxide reductase
MRSTALLAIVTFALGGAAYAAVPDFTGAPPKAATPGEATAVFAGGCFWGVDAVFKHVKGVKSVVSGYSGGSAQTAKYMLVGTGTTGHAEAVKVTYDPSQITYADLMKVFFSVAHDPTEKDRQGPDVGTQYRSAIFYADPQQKELAQRYIAQLDAAKAFGKPIVTKTGTMKAAFYPAEAYHQDYATRHPSNPYIVFNDAPKVENLKRMFGSLYRDKPVLVADSGMGN